MLLLGAFVSAARADPLEVVYPQGSAHGFVEVTASDGTRLAVGDLTRRLRGTIVTSRLVMKFLDGSLDDETTVFSQDRVFHLIGDHHVQSGPSFPKPIDVTVDTAAEEVISKDNKGSVTRTRMRMPADLCNGLTLTLLMNLSPTVSEIEAPLVTGSTKLRLVHLLIKKMGTAPFMLGGLRRQATDYSIHVELGGVVGVIAPLVGKEPPDFHVLITTGENPAFIREEGAFFEGGPIWRVQQISATFPAK